MGCIIKIGNQSVSETDFLNHLNKIISVNKLFEENPKFSSQIYEALGFEIHNKNLLIDYYNNNIKDLENQLKEYFKTGKGISDFYLNEYINANEKQINSLHGVKNNINVLSKNLKEGANISDKQGVKVYEYGDKYVIKEGVILSQEIPALTIKNVPDNIHIVREIGIKNNIPVTVMTKAPGVPLKRGDKIKLSEKNKEQLFKDTLFLEKNNIHVDPSKANNFYYHKDTGVHFIDLKVDTKSETSDEFLKYYFEDGIYEDYQIWKETNKLEIQEITPEQKQQAQQLYSQYLDSLSKPNTNPILQDSQKPDVILPIGTSGSGKSTFIKSLPQENLVVIEPDAMRVEFTGNMNDKSKDKEIYIEAAKRAIKAIKQGKQVVFDTTNLTKDKRLPFIEAIKKEIPNANIQYKLMELNPELAKQRIKAQLERGENRANVSDETIDRHAASYKQMLEDIKSEPISNYDIQQEQVKKFAELQERLNNKEFLEGAKNAYENSEGLKSFGTQEQYNDYIARVSLGIIKNPSSGGYNYTSEVKDIVYHATNASVESFDKNKISSNTLNYGFYGKGFYFNETKDNLISWWKTLYKKEPNVIKAIINTKNPYSEASSIIEEKTKLGSKKETEDFTNSLLSQKYDAVLPKIPKNEGSNEFVVFEPEQIHILGSKQDIEGFKEFVNKPTTVDKNQLQKQNIEITNHNYTRQEVQNNPNTAYVFTENTYSITAFSNRAGGGSAIIRGLPNAFAIVTKKKYDYNTRENVDYTDTDANFKEFTEINTKLINELKNSGKDKIVFPQGFATDKAKMPTRFAEWLQKELLDSFGLVTELNTTKTGLISKNISQVVDSGIDTSKKINIYAGTGENAELSNLADRPFTLQGVEYDNVEQYFQLQKFQTAGVLEFDYDAKNAQEIANKINKVADAIANTKNGFEAKKLGGTRIAGTILNEEFWNNINSSEMKKAIKASFEQNPKALQQLLATGNAELTHTQESVKSKWRTEFPKLLMEVRQELKPNIENNNDSPNEENWTEKNNDCGI